MQIEMGKKYRLVGTHEPVRIICVDRRHSDYTCIGLVQSSGVLGESPLSFNSSGSANGIQIVEEVPTVDWAKVAVDTPIIVKSDTGYKYRHLAYFLDVRPERLGFISLFRFQSTAQWFLDKTVVLDFRCC